MEKEFFFPESVKMLLELLTETQKLGNMIYIMLQYTSKANHNIQRTKLQTDGKMTESD